MLFYWSADCNSLPMFHFLLGLTFPQHPHDLFMSERFLPSRQYKFVALFLSNLDLLVLLLSLQLFGSSEPRDISWLILIECFLK